VVGIAIIALPSGILTQGYMEVIEEEKKKKETQKEESERKH